MDFLQGMHISFSDQPSKVHFHFEFSWSTSLVFCEDYDKIVYGLKHSLTLVRKTDDGAIFRGGAAGCGKISLDILSWFMPHVIPTDAGQCSIYKTIESKVKLPVEYRTRQCDLLSVPESTRLTWWLSVKTAPEKPRFIIVGFQTAKDGDQTKNPSMFDHVNSKTILM